MAHVGKTIEHPLTGERITFLETAGSTGGKFLRIRLDVRPGGAIPNVHVHPAAEEQFAVAEGRLQVRRAKQAWVAKAGETVIVPPGTAHVWANPFDEPAAVIVDLRPALRAETFFETFFGLARDGKVDPKRNLPKSLLQTALMFHDYRAEIQLPGITGAGVRGLSGSLHLSPVYAGIAHGTRNTAVPKLPSSGLGGPSDSGESDNRMAYLQHHRDRGGGQAGRRGRARPPSRSRAPTFSARDFFAIARRAIEARLGS